MTLQEWCGEVRGRQAVLAEHLRCTKSFVSQMVRGDVRIPPEHYRAIRAYTRGDVGFEDMIPPPPAIQHDRHSARTPEPSS